MQVDSTKLLVASMDVCSFMPKIGSLFLTDQLESRSRAYFSDFPFVSSRFLDVIYFALSFSSSSILRG